MKTKLSAVLLVALGLGTGLTDATAQEARHWQVDVRYDYNWMTPDHEDWQRQSVLVDRSVGKGALVGTVVQERRFASSAGGAGLDFWQSVWADAYGRVGFHFGRFAPFSPRANALADLYQTIGTWEVSGHYNGRRYGTGPVHLLGIGLGRYVGEWYLRTQTTVVPRPTTYALAQRVNARRYYVSVGSLSFVDLEFAGGRTVEYVGRSRQIKVLRTLFIGARSRHFLTPHYGLTAAVRYASYEVFHGPGGSIGVIFQW